jgi:glycosyltransferase involved in cell wall biosynthesis
MNHNRKRALFCIPSYTFGGAEKHSFQTAKVLLEAGYEVFFIAFGKTDGFDLFLKSHSIGTLHYNLGNFEAQKPFVKFIVLLRLTLLLRKIKPQLIFSGTKQENVIMGLIWRFVGAKSFFWHQWGIDTSRVSRLERIGHRLGTQYIANSRACAENITERHGLSSLELVTIIHNAVERPERSSREHLPGSPFRIIMTANFYPEKDHLTVLRALAILNEKYPHNSIQLLFAGSAPGTSSQLIECKALAFELGLNPKQVQFLGKIDDIYPLLATCDAGILSTTSEGLSNAIMEYMTIGIPVIATEIDQNKEVLGKVNYEYLFPVGNAEKCAELMEKLYLDRELLSEIGDRNRNRVMSEFNIERYRSSILKLLN